MNPGAPSREDWARILAKGMPLHRNPGIYAFLREARMGEGVGQGVSQMRKLLVAAGAPEPEFDSLQQIFLLTLFAPGAPGTKEALRQKILELARTHGAVSSPLVARELNTSRPSALILLKELARGGRLRHQGAGRSSHYSLPGTEKT